ncbi:DUF2860 family protein [Vibrio splendidus]|uniref:DUF2860 family protein n=1 Tax=Vibrio splendidus TaxID=29497 RepID=UPI000066FC46|nr:DUF2860 family protein [Vibrio splendidus]EAP95693.1 hypothetical protein V12B01_02855 [Vibrio splendidus 12B01]OCH63252.1 hypothetical protein A6D94_15685 [Vibrio splendidus]
MNKYSALLVSLLVNGAALADGFEGELSYMVGYGKSTSNLSTEKSTKTGELNSAGPSHSNAQSGPFGQLRYNFGDQKVYVGMARDDIIQGVFAMELGYSRLVADQHAISFSYLPTIANGKVWQDPYLVNRARKETDISGNAYRITIENVQDAGLKVDLAYYNQKLEHEFSGSSDPVDQTLLRRGGKGYNVELSHGIPLRHDILLLPSVGYRQFDADGKAMAYGRYSAALTTMYIHGNHLFSLHGGLFKADYKAVNPVFKKKREDKGCEAILAYEYQGFMGWDNLGFNALASYSRSDSNITFYDENDYMVGVGVSYVF